MGIFGPAVGNEARGESLSSILHSDVTVSEIDSSLKEMPGQPADP